MAIKVIIDPGSTHMGKLDYARELIDIAKDLGVYAIKFQLFGPEFAKGGNIPLPKEWLPELIERADQKVIVTASAFDDEHLDFLIRLKVPFIKFAYSQKHKIDWQRKALEMGIKSIVSCDVMTDHQVLLGSERLYCISEYPVQYQIDFENIFPRFDGFSSHCLGVKQDERAIMAGARMIEKHITLDHADISCPDHFFALHPKEMEQLVMMARYSS